MTARLSVSQRASSLPLKVLQFVGALLSIAALSSASCSVCSVFTLQLHWSFQCILKTFDICRFSICFVKIIIKAFGYKCSVSHLERLKVGLCLSVWSRDQAGRPGRRAGLTSVLWGPRGVWTLQPSGLGRLCSGPLRAQQSSEPSSVHTADVRGQNQAAALPPGYHTLHHSSHSVTCLICGSIDMKFGSIFPEDES